MSIKKNKVKSDYLKALEEQYDFIYASANNIVFNFKFFCLWRVLRTEF